MADKCYMIMFSEVFYSRNIDEMVPNLAPRTEKIKNKNSPRKNCLTLQGHRDIGILV